VLLLTVSCLTFLVGLGRAAIGDSDEAFYAEAAREMVQSGDWLTPRYNYEDRFQKPILYYWLAAAAFSVAGPSEAAARFPAAASGVALVLLAWIWGRRWYDERTGTLAGLVTATSFGYFSMARQALPDLPLAALMTLAAFSAFEAARLPTDAPPNAARTRLWWLLTAGAASGLAMLMKGPVGVALPALAVLAASRLGWLGPRRWIPVRPSHLGAAAALFLAIAAPWFLAMVFEHGVSYLHRFFVAENVERFATDRYNEPRSLFFYVPIVLGGLAPWSPFLLLWIPSWIRAFRTRVVTLGPLDRALALWAAVPFVFYSLSVGKQPRYVLPMLPPLAILLARTLRRRVGAAGAPAEGGTAGGPQQDRTAIAWLGTASAFLLVALGGLLLRATPLLDALSPVATRVTAALVVTGGLGVTAAAWRRPRALPWALGLASALTLLGLQYSVFSARGSEPVQRMAAAFLVSRTGDEPSATHRAFVRNLVFYTGVPQTDLPQLEDVVEFLGRPERVLCVIREHDLERLAAEHGVRPRVLASIRYFNPAGMRLKTLLWPEPDRDLEHVHLVANR
jgi:4-amino-4-deoxy-L-arabinose transferase-like glycosyltransferase